MNPIFLTDFYKVGHVIQYPDDTEYVWTNLTPRSTRIPDQRFVVYVGMQYLLQKYLVECFNREFFLCNWERFEIDYIEFIQQTLHVDSPKTDHIKELHSLGYLPLKIYSLPEGTKVDITIPAMVITNTDPRFYWLPNYLETLISSVLWKPCTSATKAYRYKTICNKWSEIWSTKHNIPNNNQYVQWQCHDFSMRGMSGIEDAVLSGIGHLTSFSGTDTIASIKVANEYYDAPYSIGGSVPATEHSVMCAGTKEEEFETFKRLITEVYPEGIISIVSDTWDLWKVLTDYMPRLKDVILKRNGKIVIRPDSGDPELIVCGDPNSDHNTPKGKGVIRLLDEVFGHNELGILNNVACIYGDSITEERCNNILGRIVNEINLSPANMVFGVGSYTYEYVTRDVYGWAMKATAVIRNGVLINIFKDPITDNGGKKSCKGIPTVYRDCEYGELYYREESNPEDLDNCEYNLVFENGKILNRVNFNEIRERLNQ